MGALDLSSEVEALFRSKIDEFLSWAESSWAVTEKDRHDEAFRDMSDEQFESYNAGIRSMRDGFKIWIEEFPV